MSEKLFYKSAYIKEFNATVKKVVENDKGLAIILDKTAFYPEGGGQPSDLGFINEIAVKDVQEEDNEILHYVDTSIEVGLQVKCKIDWSRRFDLMVQHSGEHIVSGLINNRFGYDNVGFHLGSEMITIDLNGEITKDELKEIEIQANNYIWENHKTEILYPSAEELQRLDYRSKKELSGDVRIIRFPDADTCACCGLHVETTAEIGFVKLISVQKFHDGVRIEMLSGKRAYEYIAKATEENSKISALLSAKVFETSTATERLLEENQQLKFKLINAENKVLSLIADNYKNCDKVLINHPDLSPDNVRKLAAILIEQNTCLCCVFSGNDEYGYKYAIAQKDGDLRSLVKEMNTSLNGRGGGKPFFAQGSVSANWKDISEFMKLYQ